MSVVDAPALDPCALLSLACTLHAEIDDGSATARVECEHEAALHLLRLSERCAEQSSREQREQK